MNFFEQELRKLFENDYPNATFVGRKCYIPLGARTQASIYFTTGLHADHYDRLHIDVIDREQGRIDRLILRFEDLLGMKRLSGGRTLEPHIWIYKNDVMWYTGQPTQQEYQVLRQAASDYIQLYQEPEHRQSPDMTQTM